jgi:hypothetical protein
VRFTLLLASSALAASLVLSACSTTGGSQSIPGSQSAAPMSHQGPQFAAYGQKQQTSCPSQYFVCITLAKGTTQEGICISTSGNCSSGLVGSWNWANKITTTKGKKYKKIKVSVSPNPGNPVEFTYSVKKIKNTKGKVKWVDTLNACNVSDPSSCVTGEIGLLGS